MIPFPLPVFYDMQVESEWVMKKARQGSMKLNNVCSFAFFDDKTRRMDVSMSLLCLSSFFFFSSAFSRCCKSVIK